MAILFCPQFALTLSLLLILIPPISSSQDLREAQSFGSGSPWWFSSSLWALGSLAGTFGSNKDDVSLRSVTSASTRPSPWALWRRPCPLLIPFCLKTSFLLRVIGGGGVSGGSLVANNWNPTQTSLDKKGWGEAQGEWVVIWGLIWSVFGEGREELA